MDEVFLEIAVPYLIIFYYVLYITNGKLNVPLCLCIMQCNVLMSWFDVYISVFSVTVFLIYIG